MCDELLSGFASESWHFHAIRSLRLTSEVADLALSYTTASVGDACGFPQGELQASLSALATIVKIVTPLVWGRSCAYGVATNRPSMFYWVSVAGGCLYLLILQRLISAPDPPRLAKK